MRGPAGTPFEDGCRWLTDQLGLTPSQTVGPFLHLALAEPAARHAVPPDTAGAIVVRGRVIDGDGAGGPGRRRRDLADRRPLRPLSDRTPRASGTIHTVKPPAVPTRDGTPQAPHLAVSVFARGLLDRVVTRCYFGDEVDANADRSHAGRRSMPSRRHLLVADGTASDGYRFDIRLQGDDESVFFAV